MTCWASTASTASTWSGGWRTSAGQRGGRFISVGSEDALDWVLFDQLRRRGWVQ